MITSLEEMPQTTDPMTLALTGGLPLVLLISAALALLVSLFLLRRYRRAVTASMRMRAKPGMSESAPHETAPPPAQTRLDFIVLDHATDFTNSAAAEEVYAKARRTPWRAAIVYAAAGLCFSAIITAAWLAANKSAFLPIRFLFICLVFAWPAVLTINLVAASSPRVKWSSALIYFVILAAIGVVALARSAELTWAQIITLWLIYNLPPSVVLWTFLNRKIRAVGPLVLIFLLIVIAGANLVLAFVAGDERWRRIFVEIGVALGLEANGILAGLILLGCLLFAPAGWLLFRGIRSRYERKKISDQSLTLDALWLLFGVMDSIYLAFAAPAWILSGFAAFFVFKMVTWIGFSRLRPKPDTPLPSQKLLLLRVFSLGKRSERLFDALGMHWRYLGSIQMIAGPDLATTNIEAHEFMDFLSGKLARRFIDGPQTLDRRLSEADYAPDWDRRFRVNEFFCYQDTWKMVLAQLVKENEAVLMDLRGFSRLKSGCIFEINELINAVPLERVVFNIDNTTDEQFLRQTVEESWKRMRLTSPNRLLPSTQLRLFRLTGLHHHELAKLLQAVCAAAQPAAGNETT